MWRRFILCYFILFFSAHDTNPFEVVSLISHCLLVSGAAQNKTLLIYFRQYAVA